MKQEQNKTVIPGPGDANGHPGAAVFAAAGTETRLSNPGRIVRGGSGTKISRKNRAWWIILLITLSSLGCAKPVKVAETKGPVLTAVKAAAVPKIDGLATEVAWKAAPAAKINTKNGPVVTMKAVYTDTEIFLTATWPDSTKSDIQRVWTYSNGAWQGGQPDDSFSIIWDDDDSIQDFKEDGCGVLCHKPSADPDSWRMEIIGPPASPNLWPGRNQRGDMWDLSLAISNVKGTVSDYTFAIDPAYLKSPSLVQPRIFRQNDQFTDSAPWRQNYLNDETTGARRPAYMYKTGLSLDSTPYPTDEQMTPILPGTHFKEGDRLPYMIFALETQSWQGSKNDLKGKGVWADGFWTIEISRRLNTQRNDDIRFTPDTGRDIWLALAVFNATIIGHTPSAPMVLRFE